MHFDAQGKPPVDTGFDGRCSASKLSAFPSSIRCPSQLWDHLAFKIGTFGPFPEPRRTDVPRKTDIFSVSIHNGLEQ